MENNRGQSIFLSVVGIATLLVAIVGATFAYFSIQVTGNESASSIQVTTAKVGGVTYTDGSELIQVNNAYPGYTKTKTFTIATDTGADAPDSNSQIQYQIFLVTTNADLSSAAVTHKTSATNDSDFTYSLAHHAGSPTGTGTMATAVSNQSMPTSTGDTLLGTGTLVGTDSHTYDFTVTLEETHSSQNDLQGLTYQGRIKIVVGGEHGEFRTWNEATSGWTTLSE